MKQRGSAGSSPTGHKLGRAKPQPWLSVLMAAPPTIRAGAIHLADGTEARALKATLLTCDTPLLAVTSAIAAPSVGS